MKPFHQNSGSVLHLRSSGAMLGAESVILEIAKHSRRFGYRSIVGSLRNRDDPSPEFVSCALSQGLEVVEFVCNRGVDLKCARLIRDFVVSKNVKIVHCHGYKEDFYGIMSHTDAFKIATNHLWKTHSRRLRIYRVLDAIFLHMFDMVAGVSDEIIAEMKRFGIKDATKVLNGIDTNKFNNCPGDNNRSLQLGIRGRGTVFCMVSSLTPEKNHAFAIHSMAMLKDRNAQLVIVGDGPLKGELQNLVSRLGLVDKVTFLGRQSRVGEILSVVDVFLLSSIREGMPMALLEAMACGKAVIVSRVGEIANIVDNKVSGLVFDPGDLASLVEAMKLLIDHNELITSLGKNARKKVEQSYSSVSMTRMYCDLYDQLLAGRCR